MATLADNSCKISQTDSNKVASMVEVCPMCNKIMISLTIYSKQ